MTETRLSREEIIERLVDRDGLFCQYPGCEYEFTEDDIFAEDEGPSRVTIDHWVPLALDGTWELGNLRLMEKRCNARKGALLPNDDGTLPRRRQSGYRRRKEKRAGRPILCSLCESGRLLQPGDTCPLCKSPAQPVVAPASLQREPKECDHNKYHCWMCYLGFVERKAAIQSVIEGDLNG